MSLKKYLPSIAALALALSVLPAAADPMNDRLAAAQKDPAVAESLMKVGRKAAGAVCANCHGEGGNSVQADVPNLAGQNRAYLLEQMRLFADSKRRHNFMEGMAKSLTVDEKVGLVMLFSSLEVQPKPAIGGGLVDKGAAVYRRACVECHGPQGRGNEQIARLAGQQLTYLRNSLQKYRDSSGVRTNPQMVKVARSLTPEEIEAVTAYVYAMK